MKPKKIFSILLCGLAAGIVLTGIALAASGPAIGWEVLSGGGAPASGGAITLNDTLGQPVVGPSTGGDIALGSGYWYGLGYDETKCGLTENTIYSFNQTWPVSVTLQTKGSLECLRVRRFDQNHAERTGASILNGVGWGRYWTITAADSFGAPASGYTLTLALPHDGLNEPRACRYPGEMGGAGWDCDDGSHTTFTASTVTRSGVTALSDWAVGNVVGPTNVTLIALSIHSSGSSLAPGMIGLFAGLVLSVVIIRQLRRRKKD